MEEQDNSQIMYKSQRTMRRERISRERKKAFRRGIFFTVIMEIIIIVVGFFTIRTYRHYFPRIEEGHIVRNFSEIIRYLPQKPDNFLNSTYEGHIPEFIQRDINKILEEDELYIVYQSEDTLSKLIIRKNSSGEIEISAYKTDSYWSDWHQPIKTDVSFYQTEEGFSVYGRDDEKNRALVYYEFEEGRVTSGEYYDSTIDLLGVDEIQGKSFWEDDNYIWGSNKNLTLLRDENVFKFYYKGTQIGESIKFPGADISECAYTYILDANNDMYYMYYCADMNKPWIHFEKVAEGIDEVTSDYVNLKYGEGKSRYEVLNYYIYVKDGKRYVAIPDMETELAYGQRYGKLRDLADVVEPNYSVQTIEISENNIREIKIVRYSPSSLIYVQYMYGKDSMLNIYMEKILRGIDNFIEVPESEIEPLLGTIQPEEYEERIQAIKDVYQKYEN